MAWLRAVAGFQVFGAGRIWVFGDTSDTQSAEEHPETEIESGRPFSIAEIIIVNADTDSIVEVHRYMHCLRRGCRMMENGSDNPCRFAPATTSQMP